MISDNGSTIRRIVWACSERKWLADLSRENILGFRLNFQGQPTTPDGSQHRFEPRGDAHFGENVRQMSLDGPITNEKRLCNRLVI
jgi:hypothetical protein